jgi:hypothetical protein
VGSLLHEARGWLRLKAGGPGKAPLLLGGLSVLAVLAVLAGGVLLLSGYHRQPRAPALDDDPVYQDEREGFRFTVPEGWHQYARSQLPPGKLEKEQVLVEYRKVDRDAPAQLDVSAVDLPGSTDLAEYLAEPSYGEKSWRLQASPEPIEVAGVPGTRFDFVGRPGKDGLAREVVAFRRGERVYLFTALFLAHDASAREQFRRSVGRLQWR